MTRMEASSAGTGWEYRPRAVYGQCTVRGSARPRCANKCERLTSGPTARVRKFSGLLPRAHITPRRKPQSAAAGHSRPQPAVCAALLIADPARARGSAGPRGSARHQRRSLRRRKPRPPPRRHSAARRPQPHLQRRPRPPAIVASRPPALRLGMLDAHAEASTMNDAIAKTATATAATEEVACSVRGRAATIRVGHRHRPRARATWPATRALPHSHSSSPAPSRRTLPLKRSAGASWPHD